MIDFQQLINTQPVIIPPTPQIIYDKMWVDTMTITSPQTNIVRIYTKLLPCRDNLDTGDKEIKQNLVDKDIKIVCIDNLWEIIETSPKFAQAFELILEAVNEYGIQQGVLVDPNTTTPIVSGE